MTQPQQQTAVMTATFSGVCVGGPLHGQHLSHAQPTKDARNDTQDAIVRGVYKYLNYFGEWHWEKQSSVPIPKFAWLCGTFGCELRESKRTQATPH
jgi:hypothetical protein